MQLLTQSPHIPEPPARFRLRRRGPADGLEPMRFHSIRCFDCECRTFSEMEDTDIQKATAIIRMIKIAILLSITQQFAANWLGCKKNSFRMEAREVAMLCLDRNTNLRD